MAILVTGGSGFIGSHMVEHLIDVQDENILILDNFSTGSKNNISHLDSDQIDIITGDIRNSDLFSSLDSNISAIYHFAAAVGVKKVLEDPLYSFQTNLHGTENIIRAAVEAEVPIFLASTSEIYGKNEKVPLSENDDRLIGPISVPRWGYATSKATDEFLSLLHYEQSGLPVRIGRFFNIVGPRQTGQYGMVIPRFVEQALNGEPITVYGDGTQTRSFTHVKDAVKITYDLMKSPEACGEAVNIGTSNPTTINQLANRVIELTDSDSDIEYIPFEEVYNDDFEEPSEREPDLSKLQNLIGWKPTTDLDRILKDVIDTRIGNDAVTI
ncbi:GDP-mannose 4,6-dehydratase [Halovenus sp. HT40]|uniref:GDP-mannose 4,6-dehydratase n=1 Tax=Halovenus sp. HT40 TaxID=3126691 RepID=UPI00300F17EE